MRKSPIEFDGKSCEQMRSYLDSYLNGELLVETNHNIQKHLEGCRSCTEELEMRVRMKNLLQRAVSQETAPAALRERIQQEIRATPSVALFPFFSLTRARMALAACVLIVLCLGAWGASGMWTHKEVADTNGQTELAGTLPRQLREVLAIGLDDHVHCALDDKVQKEFFKVEEISAIQPEYAELLSAMNGQAGGDYKIAAHHCVVDGRKFVHIILKHGETVLSLAMTKKNGEAFGDMTHLASSDTARARLHHGRLQNFEVVGFETARHLAFVVSNLPEKENLRIASGITPSIHDYLSKLEANA